MKGTDLEALRSAFKRASILSDPTVSSSYPRIVLGGRSGDAFRVFWIESADGPQNAARFRPQLETQETIGAEWSWYDNPFVGTRELNGLKIVMMLLSNWDNKDVRDVARGSNTAIFEYRVARDVLEARYLIIDWGAALGPWGSHVLTRGRWDFEAFAAQNDQFVLGMDGGRVSWGYKGQRTADAVADITASDVAWLYGYLERITDEQLAAGLRASGATESEIAGFTHAIRDRIDRLGEIAAPASYRGACS